MAESLALNFNFPDAESKEQFKTAFQGWLKTYEQQASIVQALKAGGGGAGAVGGAGAGAQGGLGAGGESYGGGGGGGGSEAGAIRGWGIYANFIPRW